MTDQAEDPATAPEPPEMVKVTVSVPVNLLADYDRGVTAGVYASRAEALRHGLTESWRHHRGRYCTIRLDLLDPADKRPDTSADAKRTPWCRAGAQHPPQRPRGHKALRRDPATLCLRAPPPTARSPDHLKPRNPNTDRAVL